MQILRHSMVKSWGQDCPRGRTALGLFEGQQVSPQDF